MKQMVKRVIPQPLLSGIKAGLHSVGPCLEHVPKNVRIFSAPDAQIFFGYYDITPFSQDNTLLLATRAPAENTSPHGRNPVLELGFYDLTQEAPQFQKFAETGVWNWQQGCRLQWHSEDTVIYNTKDGAHVTGIKTGDVLKRIPFHVYSICNGFALTLNFRNLHRNRAGYGYDNGLPDDSEETVRLIDLNTLQARTVLTMDRIKKFQPLPSMENAAHYFNHLCFSPSGARFMVTHLWTAANGKRYSRLLVADRGGGNMICPNNSGHTSHYTWMNEDEIIVFGSQDQAANRYYLYDLEKNTSAPLGPLKQDGHQSVHGHCMITDTYPDYFRLQHLLEYDMKARALKTLAKFYTPPGFTGEMRCDLHPRLSPDGQMICVDIVRGGRRTLCVIGRSIVRHKHD